MAEQALGTLSDWMRLAHRSHDDPNDTELDPLLLAFAAAPVGIAILLLDGRFHLANPAVCRMLGRSSSELRDLSVAELLHPHHRMSVYTLAERILDENVDRYRQERAFVRPDGSVVWIDVTGIVLRDGNGTPHFILGVGHDITASKGGDAAVCDEDVPIEKMGGDGDSRSERELRLEHASEELESLCRAVSHDVRAPVRIVSGYAQILIDDLGETVDAEQMRLLEAIRTQSQRLGRLLDGLLELSRLTRSSVRRSPIDLGARARWIFEELQHQERGRDLELSVHGDLRAQADPALVDTLLENLLSNACKFTRGTAAARIEIGRSAGTDVPTYFVRDNGVGFDMAHVHNLFGVFQRLHASDEFAGDGIGLAGVKRVAQRHGGRVWASSTPGQGATFYFTLE
ncbi:MAG TPA: ATP-binding protein [Candidatus Binatia bacterium]|nr:ATP-binding protein [Candidatus Binatia bacterium]